MKWKMIVHTDASVSYECPHCFSQFEHQMIYCGNCGKKVLDQIDTLLYTEDIKFGKDRLSGKVVYAFPKLNMWHTISSENLKLIKEWISNNF